MWLKTAARCLGWGGALEALASPASDTARADSSKERPRWRLLVLRVCLLFILLMAIWFWPVGSQYVAIPPSFPCATATLAAEKAICADPLLEKIDADFTVYYQDNLIAAKTFRATAIESALKKSEANFIVARNRCGSAKWCIELQYLYQDLRISDMSGEPHRTTEPLRVYVNHYVGAYLKAWLSTRVHAFSA